MTNRNWEKEVLPHIKKELDEFKKQGIVPTLRTIFYRLASKNIIRNVKNDYSYLSDFTAKCRKRFVILNRLGNEKVIGGLLERDEIETLKSYGLIVQYKKSRYELRNNIVADVFNNLKYVIKLDAVLRINSFVDETRGVYKDFNDEYKTPEQYIREKIDALNNLPNEYKKSIPKWHEQPYHVELWTEKNAMVGTFRSILKDLDVRIVYNRGFDSVSNSWETYKRINKAWEKGKKVRILYCGDLDPSGDAMDEIIDENMRVYFDVGGYRISGKYDFKRIGVLYEHIADFHLLKNTDPDVLDKLKDDPRKDNFMSKYNLKSDAELFQYEIDALAAADPAEFKKMILDEIKPLYDEEIYDGLLSTDRYSERQISLHIVKNVHDFMDELNMKSMWNWLEF